MESPVPVRAWIAVVGKTLIAGMIVAGLSGWPTGSFALDTSVWSAAWLAVNLGLALAVRRLRARWSTGPDPLPVSLLFLTCSVGTIGLVGGAGFVLAGTDTLVRVMGGAIGAVLVFFAVQICRSRLGGDT